MDNHYQMTAHLIEQAQDDFVKALYERSKKETKMVANMFKAMANAPEILQTYLDGYTSFTQHSGFSPLEQQVIFLIISYENGCDYCLAAHATVAQFQAKAPNTLIDAIFNDTEIADEKLKVLAELTREMLYSRGHPSTAMVRRFLDAGYLEKQLLDIVLAIGIKTLSNYTNHLFQTPVDPIFKAREFKAVKFASRVLNWFKK